MSVPKVSVLIPAYNCAVSIGRALDSILNQSYENIEIIVVYDESSDETYSVLRAYQNKFKNIRIHRGPGNGLSSALNYGLGLCKGNYIARFDSDDYCCFDRIKNQVELLCASEADICGSDYLIEVASKKSSLFYRDVPSKDFIRLYCSVGVPFPHPGVMIRRRLYDLGFYKYDSECAAEDFQLWSNLLVSRDDISAVNLKIPGIIYKLHDGSISVSKKRNLFIASFKIASLNAALQSEWYILNYKYLEFACENAADRYALVYMSAFHVSKGNFAPFIFFFTRHPLITVFTGLRFLKRVFIYYFYSFTGRKIFRFNF